MPEQIFKVTTTSLKEGYQVINKARGKSIVIDEPKAFGGTDIGMSPVEALLAGLGSCKCIAGRMFAEKLNINLHELEVEVTGNLNTDGFLGDENVKIGFTDIHATYHVKADNTEAEISHFVNYVESHCPVGDTLINPASITFAANVI
ncbi:OsmC family protein [Trichococcus shcherbakoviae]|uniref:OsmC family protein n=1 Tax=Trichococcus shcherbakoviae subsp. psychrophilus TaxID=2585775 RepID=A0A5C5E3R2_9LACT|nr:OsmC family protein [Trichococcus shcherbakoviae]TNV67846.1 OsmC family protein [Trichococcus shcherbakoviae subsp. psychrophilus]